MDREKQLDDEIKHLRTNQKILKFDWSEMLRKKALEKMAVLSPSQEDDLKNLNEKEAESKILDASIRERINEKEEIINARLSPPEKLIREHLASGEIENLQNITREDATRSIPNEEDEDGEPTTLMHYLFYKVATDGSKITAKEVEDFIISKKIDVNVPVVIDGQETYPIDKILYDQWKAGPLNREFQILLRSLMQVGLKIDYDRIKNELSKQIVDNVLDSLVIKPIKIPPIPGVCSKIPNWDWKNGTILKKDGLDYDYFYCGEYYFDGEYQVVKFPKGMVLYHGSGLLANEAVAYPLGIPYYKPQEFGREKNEEVTLAIAKDSKYNLEQLLSEYARIDAGWFTDPKNARIYTKIDTIPGCEGFCLQAYKLTQDCIFLLLDNEYNLQKLLTHPKMDKNTSDGLREMFTIANDYKQSLNRSNNPGNIINLGDLTRVSIYSNDKIVANWLCDYVIYENYSGYCAPTQINKKKAEKSFHLEFVFCNPLLYLERDLENAEDMFYDAEEYPPNIKSLFNQMKKYETTNTNFHSGNIFQHSIWSLLFAEHLSGRTTPKVDDRLKRLIMGSALIHDIGKMNPEKCVLNVTRNKYMYDVIESHPEIGASYFDTGIPILNDNLKDTGEKLWPQDILKDIISDITPAEIETAKNVVLYHWHFGSKILDKFANRGEIYKNAITEYIKLFDDIATRKISIFATIIVSIADIEATQPYTLRKLENLTTDEIKSLIKSQLLPYIVSKPKIFRGTDLAHQIKASDSGIKVLNDIMELVNSS